jgi:hypothetical protein
MSETITIRLKCSLTSSRISNQEKCRVSFSRSLKLFLAVSDNFFFYIEIGDRVVLEPAKMGQIIAIENNTFLVIQFDKTSN